MHKVTVADSLQADLYGLPIEITTSPLAALALKLAELIDKGERVPECSRELRQCLVELRAMSAGVAGHAVLDQLQAKRDQRRSS